MELNLNPDGTQDGPVVRRPIVGLAPGALSDPEGIARIDRNGAIDLIVASSLSVSGFAVSGEVIAHHGLVRVRYTRDGELHGEAMPGFREWLIDRLSGSHRRRATCTQWQRSEHRGSRLGSFAACPVVRSPLSGDGRSDSGVVRRSRHGSAMVYGGPHGRADVVDREVEFPCSTGYPRYRLRCRAAGVSGYSGPVDRWSRAVRALHLGRHFIRA